MNVLFISGSATIRPQAQPELHKVAEQLRRAKGHVRIEGHTNAEARLSEERASAVKAWLVTNEHIAAAALTVRGFGDDPSGRRRVEFVF